MPKIVIGKPEDDLLKRFAQQRASKDFNYLEVGASNANPPKGFTVDRTKILLGIGEDVFAAARKALEDFKHLKLGWVDCWTSGKIQEGETIVIAGRALGLWWLNPCRIVYMIDNQREGNVFGFAHGTLPGHIERGEERFQVCRDPVTDQVHFEILAFSRPNHILSHLGYPMVRYLQKKFGRESARAMFRAVNPEPASEIPGVLQATG